MLSGNTAMPFIMENHLTCSVNMVDSRKSLIVAMGTTNTTLFLIMARMISKSLAMTKVFLVRGTDALILKKVVREK